MSFILPAQLSWRHAVGVGPATGFLAVVDATQSGIGAQKHYRINEGSGTFADRFGAAAGVEAGGTLTRSIGPLAVDSSGGSSVGGKLGPYINIPDLVPYTNSFTFGAMVMIDRAPTGGETKFVGFASASGIGAYSVEVMSDRSLRVFSEHEGGVIEKRTAAGVVPAGGLVWIGYSRATDGSQRGWVGITKYESGGSPGWDQVDDADPTLDDTTNPGSKWRAPPAGDHAVMAFSGGDVPMSGIFGELVVWGVAISTADVEAVAAEALPNVAWLAPTVDLGTVVVDASTVFKAIPTASIHPESGLTAVVDTGPSEGVGVAASGQGFNVTGSDTVETDSFTAHVTIGAASSDVVTFDIETIANGGEPGPGPPNPPTPDTGDPAFGRAANTNSPTPDTGDPAFGRAANTDSSTPDTGDPAFGRADQG